MDTTQENLSMQKKELINKIEIQLVNYFDRNSIFKKLIGLNNAIDFFNNEIQFWKDIKEKSRIIESLINSFYNSKNNIEKIINNIIQEQDISKFKPEEEYRKFHHIINNPLDNQRIGYNTSLYPFYSLMPETKFIKNLYTISNEMGDAAVIYLFKQNIPPNFISSFDFFTGFIKAYEFTNQSDSLIVSRRKEERKTLSEIQRNLLEKVNQYDIDYNSRQDKFNELYNDTSSGFQKQKEEFNKDISDLIVQKSDELNRLEKAYTTHLQLAGPTQYWEERAKKYRKSKFGWLLSAIISSVLLIVLLIFILYNLPDYFKIPIQALDAKTIKGTFVLLLIISLGAYLIRLFIKLTLSTYHQEMDSEERRLLTMVFIALQKENVLTKEEFQIVLQSIFSRVDTGLLSKDSTPTMPGGIETVIEKIKK